MEASRAEESLVNRTWRKDNVLYIFDNVSYCGELEMQKWVTKDFITHETKRNTGERKKYYSYDHHPAIIDRETFQLCRRIGALKDTTKGIASTRRLSLSSNPSD